MCVCGAGGEVQSPGRSEGRREPSLSLSPSLSHDPGPIAAPVPSLHDRDHRRDTRQPRPASHPVVVVVAAHGALFLTSVHSGLLISFVVFFFGLSAFLTSCSVIHSSICFAHQLGASLPKK